MSEHLAKEADRLKNDDTLNTALDDIRSDALNDLAKADADDKTMILRLQQRVLVIDDIRSTLDRYIMAADMGQDDAGSFA